MRGKSLLVGALVLALIATPALGAIGASAINESADAAHNPYIDADVTKSEHEVGWEATWYENDQGERTDLPAEVNSTVDNPYSFVATDVNASAYGEFPRKSDEGDNEASALDATEWTTDATGTAGTGSVADVTTAPGVDAVSVSTASQTSGDTFLATYSNFSVTSDANKRSLQLAADVNTLDAGATVEVRAKDSDGDYVNAVIATGQDSSIGNTMGNATGEGLVFQRQVGEMTVSGTGDGSMGEIQSIEVAVSDANADIDIAAINAEKTGMWDFGSTKADTDGDGNLETQTVREINQTGAVDLTDVNTMGSAFDSATINDLTLPMQFWSSMQTAEDGLERWNVTAENAEQFANYDERVNDYRRLALPSAYDLSYANAELRDTVEVPQSRYQTVEYATSVTDTNFTQISYTDASSSYSTLGGDVTLATGVSAGEEVAVHYDYVVTADEFSNMMDTATGGGAPMQESSGGFFSSIGNTIGTLFGGFLGFLGLRRFRGGGS